MFSQPGWKPDLNRPIQGFWLRLCFERLDDRHGWVPVLDSAAMRAAQETHAPWWNSSFGYILSPRVILEGTDFSSLIQEWANGNGYSRAHIAQDLSPLAEKWVGRKAVVGWPTDRLLYARTYLLSQRKNVDWAMRSKKMLRSLQEAGYPLGLGWAMNDTNEGQEPRRETSAHRALDAIARYGAPKPWDVGTARITWALMGYVTAPHATPQGAWVPKPDGAKEKPQARKAASKNKQA